MIGAMKAEAKGIPFLHGLFVKKEGMKDKRRRRKHIRKVCVAAESVRRSETAGSRGRMDQEARLEASAGSGDQMRPGTLAASVAPVQER